MSTLPRPRKNATAEEKAAYIAAQPRMLPQRCERGVFSLLPYEPSPEIRIGGSVGAAHNVARSSSRGLGCGVHSSSAPASALSMAGGPVPFDTAPAAKKFEHRAGISSGRPWSSAALPAAFSGVAAPSPATKIPVKATVPPPGHAPFVAGSVAGSLLTSPAGHGLGDRPTSPAQRPARPVTSASFVHPGKVSAAPGGGKLPPSDALLRRSAARKSRAPVTSPTRPPATPFRSRIHRQPYVDLHATQQGTFGPVVSQLPEPYLGNQVQQPKLRLIVQAPDAEPGVAPAIGAPWKGRPAAVA